MGRACGAASTRLAPTVFRRADGVQTYQVLVAWSRFCSLAALSYRKKATDEQVSLIHASWRKLHAQASYRSPGPPIARADRSRCPVVRTRVGSAHGRGAHHWLSPHPHIPEGPRDAASTRSSSARLCGTCSSGSRCPYACTDRSTRQDGTLLGLRNAVP
jgi:hypothetical protein